ncbi:FYN-binding protein 1 isoform X1 [Centroberyx affinis]|uniref:FYN-binding protein 1 isoform X1 n=1 Tax=Centroberyx affinis TaxID=166261 RepID=UPI003A5C071B
MDNKADVKAIMARFQTGGTNGTEEVSPPAVRTKPALHPTLSSGPPLHTKKPVSESLSGSAISIAPKPAFLKSTISTKSAPEVREIPKTKALASRFENAQEDTTGNSKPLIANKQQLPFKPALSQDAEAKSPIHKPPLHKPSLSSTLPDSKPAFPKPSPGVASNSKPSWVKEDSGGAPSISSSTPPKIQQKPSSAVAKLRGQNEELRGANTDSANKPLHTANSAVKQSNFRTAQNVFSKDKTDQSDGGSKGEGANKLPLSASSSTPPLKPPTNKKPSFVRRPPGPSAQTNSISGDATSGPKRNPLPNSLALGPAPAKPNRPPRVNLESFKRGAEASDDGPGTLKKAIVPTPLASHPSNHSNHVTLTPPSNPPAPSLPPRHPGAIIQPDPDENYDDVGLMNSPPPPLPPSTGHPSQRAKEEPDSDGEMYEDLDERWGAADIKEQEKKREKEEKEEKKRLEAERKEQKEREKKEQDARKKFKLVGPLEVLHKVKARVDSRSTKTDVALKQGDWVDILRVQGNPEGKWLGRTQDGSFGYVKTTSVDIDIDSLKQGASLPSQQNYEPDIYDDIDSASQDNFNSGIKGPGVVLPPPPDEDGEIYDDVVDPSLDVSPSSPLDPKSTPKSRGFLWMFERRKPPASTNEVPPPSQFTAEGNSGAVIDEEIYDDVDSQSYPPLPVSSLSNMKAKAKNEDIDPKKQKKFEKEEKDFRRKFKYDGEIQVLYQVTIIPTLTSKKWSGKDLAIKPGETLDVIVKPVDNKLVCRNEEGKFGYVLTSHIVMEDADIYDDIGDDSIYDND